MLGSLAQAASLTVEQRETAQRGAWGNGFKVGYAESPVMNLGSTPRWVWIAVAVMAVAAAEYLMGPQIIPN